ncbi:MAG: mutarotase [Marinilabiliaceae bacterium]|nr:mutarotase [Marinilabiliaceae bacterium]
MNLEQHYKKLFSDSLMRFKENSYEIDKEIDSVDDNRYGITLVIRPSKNIICELETVIDQINQIEPNQYFYPKSDIHITVMSIISCYNGFSLSNILVEDYVNVIADCLSGTSSFNIEFNGLTASPSCVMVKGFFKNDSLNVIRNKLRDGFGNSILQQSLDKRYQIQTAHSTIVRLSEKLKNKDLFISALKKYENFYFGNFDVDAIDLVYNDWYQRKENVRVLHKFQLNS